jgi:hypothetical protein
MQRAQAASAHAAPLSAAATEALVVAPLVQLMGAADDAKNLLRLPRALELYERALVLAETTLPESTLLAATLLQQMMSTRTSLAASGSAVLTTDAAGLAAHNWRWCNDEQLLRLSQRCLGFLRARWAAGTLLTPTTEEAFVAECFERTAETFGAEIFVGWAYEALVFWPQEAVLTLADGAQCLHGIHEALCAAVQMRTGAHGCNELILTLLNGVLGAALEADGPWLPRLRDTCGLSQADEAKLRDLQHTLAQGESARREQLYNKRDALGTHAAADLARHGLRSCALPSCGATEEYPKTYKLCGRCRGAAYCCAAHSKEDWKRHKREDGCAEPR